MSFVNELNLLLVPKLVELRDSWNTYQKDLDRDRMIRALIETYHYIRHSVPLMELAAEKCASSKPGMADYYHHHVEEEQDHDVWLLEDLETVGLSREEVQATLPLRPTLGMVATQYYLIEHVNPMALLGYMYILEGMTPQPENVKKYADRADLPEGVMRTILEHAVLDPHHISDMRDALSSDELTDEDRDLIRVNALGTVDYLSEMYDGLRREAAAAAVRKLKIPA